MQAIRGSVTALLLQYAPPNYAATVGAGGGAVIANNAVFPAKTETRD